MCVEGSTVADVCCSVVVARGAGGARRAGAVDRRDVVRTAALAALCLVIECAMFAIDVGLCCVELRRVLRGGGEAVRPGREGKGRGGPVVPCRGPQRVGDVIPGDTLSATGFVPGAQGAPYKRGTLEGLRIAPDNFPSDEIPGVDVPMRQPVSPHEPSDKWDASRLSASA